MAAATMITTTLFQYIRTNKGRRKGILVSGKDSEGLVSIGWSLCSKQDKFDLNKAYLIAEGRMDRGLDLDKVPHSISKNVDQFIDRCKRYYHVD